MAELLDDLALEARLRALGVVPEIPCPACGSRCVTFEERDSTTKPVLRRCSDCRAATWPKLAKNEEKRYDHNRAHRKAWRARQGGELRCQVCGASESESSAEFHIDHVLGVEESDQVEDTMPLCGDCHTIAGALRRIVQRRCAA